MTLLLGWIALAYALRGGLDAAFVAIMVVVSTLVWLASEEQTVTVQLPAVIANASVGTAMIRTLHALDAETPLEKAADQMIANGARLAPVTRAGTPIGVVTAEDLAEMLALHGVLARVGAIAHPAPTISVDDSLEHALDKIERADDGTLLVVDHGVLVGVLTPDQLATYATLRTPRRTIAAWQPTRH